MVPPDRIELSTSPLPMARSTPELRRHIILGVEGVFDGVRRVNPQCEGAHNAIGFLSMQASLDEVLSCAHHDTRY